jgi:hypothetical protein
MDPHPNHPKPDSAEARVSQAVEAIDEAQRALERAAQQLSSVVGMIFETRKLQRLHKEVTRTWYLVRGRSEQLRHKAGLRLDEEAGLTWRRTGALRY